MEKLIAAVTARKADVAEEVMSHLLDLAQRLMLEAIAHQAMEPLRPARRRDGLTDEAAGLRVPAPNSLIEAAGMLEEAGEGAQISSRRAESLTGP